VWFEIVVEVSAQHGEAVANFLIENGAPGIWSEDRSGHTLLTAHFANEPPLDSLRRFCADLGGDWLVLDPMSFSVRRIVEEDWAENWKLHFQPQLIGERLCICPSWASTTPPGRIAIVIDPGMAFGTGHHASTRSCLLLLESAVRQGHITRALDVGTGSGVLAIALAKLGVNAVLAVDNDPTARAIAAANVASNEVSANICIASTLDAVHGTFDLVTANLFANLLHELAPRLTRALRPSGLLICSGLLTADERALRNRYEALGLQVDDRYEEHAWVTLGLRRAPA
jgi:ribosomal protein L11 methyltransferase